MDYPKSTGVMAKYETGTELGAGNGCTHDFALALEEGQLLSMMALGVGVTVPLVGIPGETSTMIIAKKRNLY